MTAATSSVERVPLKVGITAGSPLTSFALGSRIDSLRSSSSAVREVPSASRTFRPKSLPKLGPIFSFPSTLWHAGQPDFSTSAFPRSASDRPAGASFLSPPRRVLAGLHHDQIRAHRGVADAAVLGAQDRVHPRLVGVQVQGGVPARHHILPR